MYRIYGKISVKEKETDLILDILTTSQYDEKVILEHSGNSYSAKDLKGLIGTYANKISSPKDNVVIVGGDNFNFIIQFFGAIFARKNIYLISDKTRLNSLDIDYDILERPDRVASKPAVLPEIHPKNIVVNFFTSGSSTEPKIIKKSLWNLIREGEDLGSEFGIKNKDYTVISTTTMAHLFGMTFHLMFPLCNGLKICTDVFSYPENIDVPNSILVSSPAFLASLLKHNLTFSENPKYIISAGSKLEEGIFRTASQLSNVIEIYGSTETGVIAYKTMYDKPFTIFPNVKALAGADDIEVESDYAYEEKVRVNDKVSVNGSELVLKSRSDRLFKIHEKRVSADELEMYLKKHDFVKDAYIMKIGDKLVCMCALSEEGREFILSDDVLYITKTLKHHLWKYSEIIPQRWKYIDKIPLTPTGKIDKKLIAHLFNIKVSHPIILDRELTEDSITYKIFVHKRCNFFNGHFPDFNIVPGVVQILFAKELTNFHFNMNVGEGQWKRIKFSNIIKPDSIVNLKLTKSKKDVSYKYYSEDKKYASGAFLCENVFKDIY